MPVLILIGLVLIMLGFYQLLKLNRPGNWVKVEAVVDSAAIDEIKEPMVYVFYKFYCPFVNYRYEVNGHSYKNNLVCLDKKSIKFLDKEKAQRFLSHIIDNKFAFYNPKNPAQAVLIPDISSRRKSHCYALMTAGVLLIAFCFVFI